MKNIIAVPADGTLNMKAHAVTETASTGQTSGRWMIHARNGRE